LCTAGFSHAPAPCPCAPASPRAPPPPRHAALPPPAPPRARRRRSFPHSHRSPRCRRSSKTAPPAPLRSFRRSAPRVLRRPHGGATDAFGGNGMKGGTGGTGGTGNTHCCGRLWTSQRRTRIQINRRRLARAVRTSGTWGETGRVSTHEDAKVLEQRRAHKHALA
jgi:hypothetical protein